MRIPQATEEYIQSEELKELNWNGQEIINGELLTIVGRATAHLTGRECAAFQVAWAWPKPRVTRISRAGY